MKSTKSDKRKEVTNLNMTWNIKLVYIKIFLLVLFYSSSYNVTGL